jgi:hypothetical protein
MATLVPDADTIQQSLAAVHSDVGNFAAAVQVIATADLTTLPWLVVESEAPDVFNAIQSEQQNAKDFMALSIVADIVAGLAALAGVFAEQSDKLLTVYTDAGGNALTPDQQAAANAAVAVLVAGVSTQVQLVQAKSTGAKTLEDVVNTPNNAFQTGEASAKALSDSTQKKLDDLEAIAQSPFESDPSVGMGIIAYQALINELNDFQSAMQMVISTNQAMGDALSGDLIVWHTLLGKYQAVADALKAAAADANILSAGDIRSAQAAWSQLETYARALT